jgi:putative tricarboxylic transport membrane protein
MSYAVERRVSKHPEKFGHGAIEGVAGPESANNAASCGALVPMLALGVPTGPVPAVLLAALMIHGINPGPLFIKEQPTIFWGLVASMYLGNFMLLLLNLPLVGIFINFLRIPYRILYPIILMFCIIGVYAVNTSFVDVGIMSVMGVLGYLLRKFDFETAPVVLGVVLAPIIEMSLRQSLAMSNGTYAIFLQRPISAVFLTASLVMIFLAVKPLIRKKQDWRERLAEAEKKS